MFENDLNEMILSVEQQINLIKIKNKKSTKMYSFLLYLEYNIICMVIQNYRINYTFVDYLREERTTSILCLIPRLIILVTCKLIILPIGQPVQ